MSNSSSKSITPWLRTWEPKEYQKKGELWLSTKPSAALFWPPGLGKTTAVYAAKQKLDTMGYGGRLLVLAPTSVAFSTWMNEHKKWAQFAGLKVGLAHGKNRVEALLDKSLDIVVLNYEGLPWARDYLIKPGLFKILCFDELTRVKRHNTVRFKHLKPLLKNFMFKWGLTGTPVPNGYVDLFGQVYALDEGIRLSRYITHYRSKYFFQMPFDPYTWYLQPGALEKIKAKLGDLAYYVDPLEHLDLPPLIHVPRPVVLPPSVFKQYQTLEEDLILKLEAGIVPVANAAVLTSKLRQFTSGVIYDEDANTLPVHEVKLEALESLVEEMNGEPLLVAYNFTSELELMGSKFPDALVIRGGMNKDKLKEVMEQWNLGESPLLFAQADTAAHGLNLQFGGSAVCWFSQTYNLETFIQLIARVYRQGQTNTVRVFHLLAEGTIDEHVSKVLTAKDVTQNDLFKALLALGH